MFLSIHMILTVKKQDKQQSGPNNVHCGEVYLVDLIKEKKSQISDCGFCRGWP